MATTPVLNLYKPSGSDYVSVDRDINENLQKIDDAFGSLFYVESYSASSVSANPNAGKSLKGSDFGIEAIPGYTPLALLSFWSNNTAILFRSIDLSKILADETSVIVRNVYDTAVSDATMTLIIIWVKTNYIENHIT